MASPRIPTSRSCSFFVGTRLSEIVAGVQRFAHTNQLRAHRALHALLGMERFPSDDTILNYFRRFSQAEIERF